MSAPGPSEGPAEMGADAQYLEAGEDDDMHEPVFLGDEHGEVVADLDEEDDAPMSDSDDDEPGAGAADMEDRDAALGDEIEPPSDDAVAVVTAHAAPVFSCAWSPTDGAVFATGGGDDVAFLHRVSDAASAPRTSSAPPADVTSAALRGHTDTVSSLSFNHDGSLLASGGLDGKALVWSVADPALPPRALEGPGGGLEWVRWHPKGNVLLAGSEDFTAWMWNAADGALMQVFAGHSNSVSCGGFSPDGKTVATGSFDGSLRLWAPRTGECSTLFMGHPYHDGPVTCLDFHPSTEGLLLTGSEDNTARLVSGVSGKVLGTLAAHAETIECVGLSGDFPFAASGAIDAKLVVWDLNTLQPRTTLQHDKAVSALRWIPGTACLYRCGETTKIVAKNFPVFLNFSFRSAIRRFLSLRSRDATKGPRSAIRADAAVDNSLPDSNPTSDAPTVHRDSRFANEQPASADTRRRRGNRKRRIRLGEFVSCPRFSPLPFRVSPRARSSANAHAHAQKIRDSRTPRRSHASLHILPHSVTIEPNPKPNRSSSIDGAVRLWDTRSSTCQAVSHGHVRGVLDLAPSPDFKSVVTASDDHTARVFRMVP